MDTTSLHTFVTIADTLSFSVAAEKLSLTQPAVSKRIISLETELGVRLFDRFGRQVQLTEAGRLLHNRAQSVLSQLEDISTQIENLAGNITGNLRLAMSHHIGLHHMPPVLHHFTRQFPQTNLELSFMDSESARGQVLAGDMEIAVITLPEEDHLQRSGLPAKLHNELVWTDSLRLVLAADHLSCAVLCHQDTNLDEKFRLLQSIPAVLPRSGSVTRTIIEKEFKKRHLEIQDRLATNYLETLKMMVKAGLGWSVLPHTMLDDSMVEIELGRLNLTRKLGIVWHPRRTLSNAARKMMEVITTESWR